MKMTHMHHMIDSKVITESLVARPRPADYSTGARVYDLDSQHSAKLMLMKTTSKLAVVAQPDPSTSHHRTKKRFDFKVCSESTHGDFKYFHIL